VTTIGLPGQVRPLVEAAYAVDPPVPPPWTQRTRDADAAHGRQVRDARDRADNFRLRSIPDLDGDLVNLLEDSSSEAEEDRGTARVRDSEDGIEVIVVQRIAGEVRYLDDGSHFAGRLLPTEAGATPDDEIARALAATTVRLPLSMTHPAVFDATLDALEDMGHEGWQESKWLAGQLVLHLDETWEARVAGFCLSYDLDTGLNATREEQL